MEVKLHIAILNGGGAVEGNFQRSKKQKGNNAYSNKFEKFT